MNGDVHGGQSRYGSRGGRFSIPDRSGHLFRHAGRHPRRRARRLLPVDAGRHPDQLGEAGAEGAERRAADLEADVGDAEVAATQQRHRALDAPRHQVGVRRLAVGEPELAAEVPGRHVHAAGERLDVQRLGVLPVDPVANAAQLRHLFVLRGCNVPSPGRGVPAVIKPGHVDAAIDQEPGRFVVAVHRALGARSCRSPLARACSSPC